VALKVTKSKIKTTFGVFGGQVLFTVLWLSFMHFNMLKTRFNLVWPWSTFEFVIMMSVLVLGTTMVVFEDKHKEDTASVSNTTASAPDLSSYSSNCTVGYSDNSTSTHVPVYIATSALFSQQYFFAWCGSRVVFLVVYLLAMVNNPKARRGLYIYNFHLCISIVMTCVGGVVNEPSAFHACAGVAIFSELGMYCAELLYLPRKDIMPIDVSKSQKNINGSRKRF